MPICPVFTFVNIIFTFRTIKRYESPSDVNQVYHFSEIHEPIFFSIGAHVAPHQVPLQDQCNYCSSDFIPLCFNMFQIIESAMGFPVITKMNDKSA